MLAVASPIALSSPSNFPRSSKDADGAQQLSRGSGLDAILNDTIEFVEGSSTGALAQAEPKYPYINVTKDEGTHASRPPSPSKATAIVSVLPSPRALNHSLYDRPIITSWMMTRESSAGFINTGNTCFLNSVLQCLIHTPPLQHLLNQHGSLDDKCHISDNFCMACKLRDTMKAAFLRRDRPFIPALVVGNLHRIAKHMRRGRQEDAHEFLRYTVDALQRSCLAGYPTKLDHKLTETTWVHKLFGGRLRSRVTCDTCGHPSDTFDAILDLSLDIQDVNSLKQAISKFTQVDHLRGANKYKCERCQRPVNAEKQLTVHDAPVCLTVHLKRFTPLGRKIGHTVEYGPTLDLQPAMSEGQHGPRYSLYAVISHAGGGPNSGHYYAHVKGPDASWYDANDESVTRSTASAVVGRKNAYMLFYMRVQGDALGAAINLNGTSGPKKGVKRKTPEPDDEDRGVALDDNSAPSAVHSPTSQHKSQFIGPRLPSPRPDLKTSILQEKVVKVNAGTTNQTPSKGRLVPYSESDDETEEGEVPESTPRRSSPPLPPSSSSVTPGTGSSSPITPVSFYGNSLSLKRKSSFDDDTNASRNEDVETKRRRPSPLPENQRREKQQHSRRTLSTPFTSSNMTNNLHATRDSSSRSQINDFQPHRSGQKQRIAGIGRGLVFNPKRTGLTAKMKPRSLI